MKYGIIDNLKKEHDKANLKDFFLSLKSTGLDFCINTDNEFTKQLSAPVKEKLEIIKESDIIIVLGGDGSLLETARNSAGASKPFLGVNYGKLGFLADVKDSEIIQRINMIEKGEYFVEERIMVNALYNDHEMCALNDVVLDRGYSQRVIKIKVDINGRFLNTYTSDGIIISTPTGSTAYNMSANGPILQPGVDAFTITPLSPHALAMRPVVVPHNSVINIIPEGNNGIMLSADGQETIEIDSLTKITIMKSEHRAKFIKFKDSDYYTILREKLGWGGFKERISK